MPGLPADASTFHITLGHRQDQRQIARTARLEEALLEHHDQLFGEPDPAEATDRNRIPVANELNGVGCTDELVAARTP